MTDIFDNKILCKNCDIKMQRGEIERNGVKLRVLQCDNCDNKIIHPEDSSDYENFMQLKRKTFKVKLRFVGNSYAVSIPREIIDFMNEQDNQMKKMVELCMEEMGRLSLNF